MIHFIRCRHRCHHNHHTCSHSRQNDQWRPKKWFFPADPPCCRRNKKDQHCHPCKHIDSWTVYGKAQGLIVFHTFITQHAILINTSIRSICFNSIFFFKTGCRNRKTEWIKPCIDRLSQIKCNPPVIQIWFIYFFFIYAAVGFIIKLYCTCTLLRMIIIAQQQIHRIKPAVDHKCLLNAIRSIY